MTGTSASTPKLSVVLPVANQADHVASMLGDFAAELRELGESFELIVVVNGSLDSSFETACRVAASTPEVIVLESGRGWGTAVVHGLAAANGEYLAYTNSARTMPADIVKGFRYALIDSNAIVKASRQTRDSILRRAGSVLYNLELRLLFHVAVWDVNGTPKVFHRDVLKRLQLAEPGDLIDAELAARCREDGIPMVEFSVYDTRRRSGVSTTRMKSAGRMYLGLLRLWMNRRTGRGPSRSGAS